MKKSIIGIAAGVTIVATGALFATGSIAPQQQLFETNTGEKLPLISTGHDLTEGRGMGMLYAPSEARTRLGAGSGGGSEIVPPSNTGDQVSARSPSQSTSSS